MFRVVILGSGASLPTLQRQASAVALQRHGEIFLLDCGEGTQLQWRRAGLRFGKLKAICISHLHGDHVNGLVGLLQTLSLNNRTEPLVLCGPVGLREYLRALRQAQGVRLGFPLEQRQTDGGELIKGNGYCLTAAPLSHGIPTLGFALVEEEKPGEFDVEAARRLGLEPGPEYGRLQRGQEVRLSSDQIIRPQDVLGPSRPGLKVAYCVDTRPCEAAVQLAAGADLFLCDATFGSELEREAMNRGHCTAEQAARMASQAKVRRLVLTHISARYHDARCLLAEADALFPDCVLASDLMQLHL